MILGILGIVGAELVGSVQLSCLLFDQLYNISENGGVQGEIGVPWFGLFLPSLLLYCASHFRLFWRDVVGIIASVVATMIGLSNLFVAVILGWENAHWTFGLEGRLSIVGYFFITLAVGIGHTTSRSFLIETLPPERQTLAHVLASMGVSLFTAVHMFVVQGFVFGTVGADDDEITFIICEAAFGGLGIIMMLASLAHRKTLTEAPLALTLDRGAGDKPIFKLAKPFTFAISAYFLLQAKAVDDLLSVASDREFSLVPSVQALTYRLTGIFQVGALVGSALFILQTFQTKGALALFQIVAAAFIAGIVLTESLDSFTAMYAFGGLGLGALRALMFVFLARTVTPANTAEGVGIFVSLGLIGQALGLGLLPVLLPTYIWNGLGSLWYAIVIAVTALIILQLPSSTGRENGSPT
jgi:hypothetical protein